MKKTALLPFLLLAAVLTAGCDGTGTKEDIPSGKYVLTVTHTDSLMAVPTIEWKKGGCEATVDWGDGTTERYSASMPAHAYTDRESHTVLVTSPDPFSFSISDMGNVTLFGYTQEETGEGGDS